MPKKKAKKAAKKAGGSTTKSDSADTAQRGDGWNNLLDGRGGSTDKRTQTKYAQRAVIDDNQLAGLYRENGLAKRIIELPADDMTRNWFKITGDTEDAVLQKLQVLGAQMHTQSGIKWSRGFGAALMVMGIDDGGEWAEPVNEDAIKAVNFLMVFDRRECQVVQESISKDFNDKKIGQPQLYRITPVMGGSSITVHESRVIRFDGALLAHREMIANAWWHDAILQAAYESLRQMGGVFDSTEFIVEDFIQTIVKIDNLFSLMASGKEDLIKQRLQLLDQSRHTKNMLLLDKNEEYDKKTASVSGLDELLDRFMMILSAASGIPVTLLMGRSPAGQNATGESDVRFYYDSIKADQVNDLSPRLERLIRYIYKSDGFTEPKTWSIKWNPVREMSDKERSELYKLNADADVLYIMHQVLTPDEVREHRFGGEEYNPNPPMGLAEEDGGDGGDDGTDDATDPPPQPFGSGPAPKPTTGPPGDPSDGRKFE
jgi:phage-related protein (TIGR01555 family)